MHNNKNLLIKQAKTGLSYASFFMVGLGYVSCNQTTQKSGIICNDVLHDVFSAKLGNTIEQHDQHLIRLYCKSHEIKLRNVAICSIQKRYRSQASFNNAVLNNRTDIVRILLENPRPNLPINVNQADNQGRTLLLGAVNNQNLPMARLLLEAGANNVVNNPSNDGATPLSLAAYHNNLNMVKLLVAHEADVNQPGNDNATPLLCAAFVNNLDMAKFLIEREAAASLSIGSRQSGNTPLHWAVLNSNKDMAKLFYRKRQSIINITNNNRKTPIDLDKHGILT